MSRRRRDAHQCFAEITAFQHAYKGGRRILQAVGDVLAIANAPIGDGGSDGAQEGRVMLGGEFVIDVAAQGKTFASRSHRRLLAWHSRHLAAGCASDRGQPAPTHGLVRQGAAGRALGANS
jgi:RimJ/RimL family protein N-acetyltransferase